MKIFTKCFLTTVFVFSFIIIFSQQPMNILVGRVYTKSTNSTTFSSLKFTTPSSGILYSVASIMGRDIETEASFTYDISGLTLKIEYEKNMGTEEYTIDEKSSRLLSTHLKGYVDGKWGQIYWTLKR